MAVLLNGAVTLAFVAFANRRAPERVMTRANLLTLSRAGSAAVLAGTAASPALARRRAWLALLWGRPSDWLDGPLLDERAQLSWGRCLTSKPTPD
jgi:hypothetical protein